MDNPATAKNGYTRHTDDHEHFSSNRCSNPRFTTFDGNTLHHWCGSYRNDLNKTTKYDNNNLFKFLVKYHRQVEKDGTTEQVQLLA
jgi:hypothetical protein